MKDAQIEALIFKRSPDPSYLLMKRSEVSGGYWQPVTGAVEKGESITAALLREVSEETGYKEDIISKIIPLNFTFDFIDSEDVARTEYPFGVELYQNAPEPRLSVEHTSFKWLGYFAAYETLYWEGNKKALEILNLHICY